MTIEEKLRSVFTETPSLRGVFVTAMPDCLLFTHWQRDNETWVAEEAAAYFGDLVRANREGLRALSSWSSDMQVTIESRDALLVIREINADFVVACAFERSAALGMVRMYVRRVLSVLEELLPKIEQKQLPRAVRILEFLDRYAPDSHAVRHRVALRTGITYDTLQSSAAQLSASQVEALESAVCDILGLDRIEV
jgi:predicted regulator of Ras-like GTPase activity (Roadblock/LC7/MglB family)